MHDRTGSSFTSTVHAPHKPLAQLGLVPVSPSSVRSTQISFRSPSTCRRIGLSLIVNEIVLGISRDNQPYRNESHDASPAFATRPTAKGGYTPRE
jgi:hypothetical protein